MRPNLRRRDYRAALCCVSVLVLAAGCTHLPPAQRQSLEQARGLYDNNRQADAVAKLDRLIADFGQTMEIGEAYYLRGLCRTKMGQPDAAGADFQQAISKSRDDDLIVRCKASLAALAFERGQWKQAADLYDEVVGRLPDKPPADQIVYYAGLAMQRAGRWKDASLQFARIVRKFESSTVSEEARRLAGWKHDYYAIQLGAFEDADNAEKAVQTYRAQNLEFVEMEHAPWHGHVVWVVMSGRYGSYDEAMQALQRVRSAQPDAYIIP